MAATWIPNQLLRDIWNCGVALKFFHKLGDTPQCQWHAIINPMIVADLRTKAQLYLPYKALYFVLNTFLYYPFEMQTNFDNNVPSRSSVILHSQWSNPNTIILYIISCASDNYRTHFGNKGFIFISLIIVKKHSARYLPFWIFLQNYWTFHGRLMQLSMDGLKTQFWECDCKCDCNGHSILDAVRTILREPSKQNHLPIISFVPKFGHSTFHSVERCILSRWMWWSNNMVFHMDGRLIHCCILAVLNQNSTIYSQSMCFRRVLFPIQLNPTESHLHYQLSKVWTSH